MSITIINAVDNINHNSFIVLRGVNPNKINLKADYFDASSLHNPLNSGILKSCIKEGIDATNEMFKRVFLRFLINRVNERDDEQSDDVIKNAIRHDKLEYFEQSIDNYVGVMFQNFTKMQDFNDICIICMRLGLITLDCDVTVVIGKEKVYERLNYFSPAMPQKQITGGGSSNLCVVLILIVLFLMILKIMRNSESNYFFCNNINGSGERIRKNTYIPRKFR